jgi:hypothetical protein
LDYVKQFIINYSSLPPKAFGKWAPESTPPNEAQTWSPNYIGEGTSNQQASTSNLTTSNQPGQSQTNVQINTQLNTEPNVQQQLQRFITDLGEGSVDGPWPRDFGVPEDEEETDRMLESMATSGIKAFEAELIIASRRKEYESALKKSMV